MIYYYLYPISFILRLCQFSLVQFPLTFSACCLYVCMYVCLSVCLSVSSPRNIGGSIAAVAELRGGGGRAHWRRVHGRPERLHSRGTTGLVPQPQGIITHSLRIYYYYYYYYYYPLLSPLLSLVKSLIVNC